MEAVNHCQFTQICPSQGEMVVSIQLETLSERLVMNHNVCDPNSINAAPLTSFCTATYCTGREGHTRVLDIYIYYVMG